MLVHTFNRQLSQAASIVRGDKAVRPLREELIR